MLLLAHIRVRMIATHECLQSINLVLLLFYLVPLLLDLRLLFFEGVDESDAEAVVLDAFDLAFRVVDDKQRVDGRDLFGAKADVTLSICFPIEADWAKSADQLQARREGRDIGLVAQRR